jgi:hypothetical protein
VARAAVDLDGETLGGPKGIDQEAGDPDVHLRHRQAVLLAEHDEGLFEVAASVGEARLVVGEGALDGAASRTPAAGFRLELGDIEEHAVLGLGKDAADVMEPRRGGEVDDRPLHGCHGQAFVEDAGDREWVVEDHSVRAGAPPRDADVDRPWPPPLQAPPPEAGAMTQSGSTTGIEESCRQAALRAEPPVPNHVDPAMHAVDPASAHPPRDVAIRKARVA